MNFTELPKLPSSEIKPEGKKISKLIRKFLKIILVVLNTGVVSGSTPEKKYI